MSRCGDSVAAGDTVNTGSSAKGLKGFEGLQRLRVAGHACAPREDPSNGWISWIRCWAESNTIFAVDSKDFSES